MPQYIEGGFMLFSKIHDSHSTTSDQIPWLHSPTDMNNNLDIVNQAMKMSDITSDIIMDFWIDYKVIVDDTIEAMMRIKLRFSYIQMK